MVFRASTSVALASLVLAVGGAAASAASPPALVKDINPGSFGAVSGFITPAGRNAYFVAFDPAHGRELWRSDGTEGGTALVKDVHPGPVRAIGSKQEFQRAAVGSEVYFVAIDGVHGSQLWKTDGSETGTKMVADIGQGGAAPEGLTAVGSKLYFSANDGVHGRLLWKTDGTAAGTRIVRDATGSGVRNPANLAAVGSELYFSASEGVHGRELWKSNGTAAGTRMVKDIFHGHGSSNPSELVSYRHKLYF